MKTINYTITTITATNNIAVAMFANKKYIYKTARNNKIALLETLKAILTKALPSDQLMEKPVLIITTQSILKGFTTGGFLDYVRTGEDASGNAFAEDEFQLICECAELYASRALNVRFIDEKMISYKDKEAQTIKQNAYNTVKQLSTKQAVQQTKAKVQTQPVSEVNETIKMINEQIKKALAEGNIETASKLTNMITQLTNPQQQPAPQETNEEDVPEEVQEEVVDETIDADDIEL
jgi:hypothetical protein